MLDHRDQTQWFLEFLTKARLSEHSLEKAHTDRSGSQGREAVHPLQSKPGGNPAAALQTSRELCQDIRENPQKMKSENVHLKLHVI